MNKSLWLDPERQWWKERMFSKHYGAEQVDPQIVKDREHLKYLPLGTTLLDDGGDYMTNSYDEFYGVVWTILGDPFLYDDNDVELPATIMIFGKEKSE